MRKRGVGTCRGYLADVEEDGVVDAVVVCASDVEQETCAIRDAESKCEADWCLVEAEL